MREDRKLSDNMRTIRLLCIVSVCLLCGVAVWLLARFHSNPPLDIPSSQAAPASTAVAEADARPTSSPEAPREMRAEPIRVTSEIQPANADSALTNSNSPVNSQDPDQNREWARSFPAQALDWLKNAPDSKQRDAIAEIAFPQLAQTNAAAAVTLAENCFGGSTNRVTQYLLDNLAQQWAGQDIQAASNWALAQPAGEQRNRLVQRIAIVESQTNPGDAARLIVEQMPPGPTQNEAAISVIYQWAQQDATKALAWAEAFPPGDLRDRAINEVKNVSAVASGTPPAN